MTQFGRNFSLSETCGKGIYCGSEGVFVSDEPLLTCSTSGFRKWKVRDINEINASLSKLYGVPVEFNAKIGSLTAVAKALDRNDFLYAQLTTLHLQIPEPPSHIKSNALSGPAEVEKQLHASGLLKNNWDPQKHPRWPRGTPSGIGGEFAPKDTAGNDPDC